VTLRRTGSVEAHTCSVLSTAISFATTYSDWLPPTKFRLLFGRSVEKPYDGPRPAQELFGYAVHHLLRARFCIERGRYWQAEYWISSARDYALSLACRRRGLATFYGRGFDDLPPEVPAVFSRSLVVSLERDELLRALACVVGGLLGEADEVGELVTKAQPRLHELSMA
jgi:hypothetical protein